MNAKLKEQLLNRAVETMESGEAERDNMGICHACGEDAYGVEPDARGYDCEACGQAQVYGMEETVMMLGI